MIRAAIATFGLSLGGAERWVVDLICHTDPARVTWTGCAINGAFEIDPELLQLIHQHTTVYVNKYETQRAALPLDQIDVWTEPPFYNAVWAAARDADVLLCWNSYSVPSTERLTIPCILCSHTTNKLCRTWSDLSPYTHLVAVSEAAKACFAVPGAPAVVPCSVLYNGADPARCISSARNKIRAEWGVSDGTTVVGYLGRYSEEKNPEAAINAVLGLGTDSCAVYYGEAAPSRVHFASELQDLCELLIPGQWRMYPPQTQIGDILSGFDVLMLASHREAFSMTLIEAWLAGVPVIATAVGSVPELEERFGPLTIPVTRSPGPTELASAVHWALTMPYEVKRAKQVASEHFTVTAMTRRWEDYLERIVAEWHAKK